MLLVICNVSHYWNSEVAPVWFQWLLNGMYAAHSVHHGSKIFEKHCVYIEYIHIYFYSLNSTESCLHRLRYYEQLRGDLKYVAGRVQLKCKLYTLYTKT